jgi:hypothetical protein
MEYVYYDYSKLLGHYENKLSFDLTIKTRKCIQGELFESK